MLILLKEQEQKEKKKNEFQNPLFQRKLQEE